jgi:hypothetical protein
MKTLSRPLTFSASTVVGSAAAAGLLLAIAPAQAAIVTYTGCSSSSFCTLTELLAGGSISVDEDGNGTIEKVFKDWTNYAFGKSPIANPATDPKSRIQVSATGSYIPGVSGSATLNYNIVGGLTIAPPSGANTWNVGYDFDYTLTSALNVPILSQETAITRGSVTTPTTGLTQSAVSVDGAAITTVGGGTITVPPGLPATDMVSLGLVNTYLATNSVSLLARRTTTQSGSASLTSYSQTYTQKVIPEPSSLVGLVVAGGLGLAMKRKKQQR